jgi:hypothetical protein
VTGRLVVPTSKAADAKAFADALAPYCFDPALRAAHGAAGETRACEYSWEAINAVVADTYVRLVEARGAVQPAEAVRAA